MLTTAAAPSGSAVSTEGAGARALAAASRAVRLSKRASDEAYILQWSVLRAPSVDFTSLGLPGWNRHGAQS
eukprot:6186814-Pleurochrysis_carterae.AAC.1